MSLVHEDSEALRRMAVFDVLVNNADRKGGHVLAMADGHRFGVDHGLAFHVEDKLRTVLWGWAGEPLDRDDADAVRRVRDALADPASELSASLADLLGADEVARHGEALRPPAAPRPDAAALRPSALDPVARLLSAGAG